MSEDEDFEDALDLDEFEEVPSEYKFPEEGKSIELSRVSRNSGMHPAMKSTSR